MVMVWILMGIGLSALRGGFGRRSACWLGEQGHRWKRSNGHPASQYERFLSYPRGLSRVSNELGVGQMKIRMLMLHR